MNKEYNGWTNYATWRVNMEILGDIIFEEKVSVDELKEIVEDCVFINPNTCNTPRLKVTWASQEARTIYIEDYARAFISQVNFYEIAKLVNEEIDEQD